MHKHSSGGSRPSAHRGLAAPAHASSGGGGGGRVPTGAVYVARCPLVGWEGLEDRLGPLFPAQLALHEMVLLQIGQGCRCYDFLPSNPEAGATAAALLSGGCVPGGLAGWLGDSCVA